MIQTLGKRHHTFYYTKFLFVLLFFMHNLLYLLLFLKLIPFSFLFSSKICYIMLTVIKRLFMEIVQG